ncbi:MAG: VWA domain-containing protein [Deltaproteobacteria bacterium]|nr:VWA domain-containing protein [Deltaproteobacteria bacterium]
MTKRRFAAGFTLIAFFGCSENTGRNGPGGGGASELPPGECVLAGPISASATTATTAYGLERTGAYSRPAVWVFHADTGDEIEATLTSDDGASAQNLALFAPPQVDRANPGESLARGVDEASLPLTTKLRFTVAASGLFTLVPRGCAAIGVPGVYRLKLLLVGGPSTGGTCATSCSDGAVRCAGDVVETCQRGLTGCLGWVAGAVCATSGQSCVLGRCEAPCASQCQVNHKRCVGQSIETCARDAAGCYSWTTTDVCVGANRCEQGVCVPQDQSRCEYPNVMILLDRSGSMDTAPSSSTSQSKFTIAKAAINSIVSARQAQISFGLMSFPGTTGSCSVAQLHADVAPNNWSPIQTALSALRTTGATPMIAALNAAIQLPSLRFAARRNFVVLLTDGQESCASNSTNGPVTAVTALANDGIKTFVVGFGGAVSPTTLNKMANAGGTARAGCNPNSTSATATNNCYYQADDPTSLTAALDAIGRNVGNEICDGLDNDCNNKIDEGLKRPCQTDCGSGEEVCVYGQWLNCSAPTRDEKGECRGEGTDGGIIVDAGP